MLELFRPHKFTAESHAIVSKANEIIRDYAADGFTLTLRQLYYQFVARDLIENTERSYKNLGRIIARAREAGMVSWAAIEDRAREHHGIHIEEDEASVLDGIEYGFALDFWEPQDVYVEVWIEKEALAGVIESPCLKYRVPHMACKGYLSASEAWRAGKRFAQYSNRRRVLIHLGDHDPSGIDMTRDNDDRLSMFAYASDIEVKRIALNYDQVEDFKLPPNPAKLTDTRAKDYVAAYGRSSWELDALDPKLIQEIISDAVGELIDWEVWAATQRMETSKQGVLRTLSENWGEVSEFIKTELM